MSQFLEPTVKVKDRLQFNTRDIIMVFTHKKCQKLSLLHTYSGAR